MEKQSILSPKPNILKRWAASLIDLPLPFVSIALAGNALTVYQQDMRFNHGMSQTSNLAIFIFFTFFASFALFYLFSKDGLSRGQSFGKRLLKLKVVDLNYNQPCSLSLSWFRQILFILLLVPFGAGALVELILCLMRKDGRGLVDLIAGTQVVNISSEVE